MPLIRSFRRVDFMTMLSRSLAVVGGHNHFARFVVEVQAWAARGMECGTVHDHDAVTTH